MSTHEVKIEKLQAQIRNLAKEKGPVSLQYGSGHSNTTRSKSYKQGSCVLYCGDLDEIIDISDHIAVVQPRVTMQQLVEATLKQGLIPKVLPEFKGITVGGAVLGGAAESSSHRFGTFNNACSAYEILAGNGSLIRASPHENSDLYHGVAGSYGSLGLLASIDVELMPMKKYVHLRYHRFSDPNKAISWIRSNFGKPDFIDGIVFAKDHTVVIEGSLTDDLNSLPLYSTKPLYAEWYYQHARHATEEAMAIDDYLFRYDRGAFWMGAYLLRPSLFLKYLFKTMPVTDEDFQHYHAVADPPLLTRTLFAPFMSSQTLWGMLHKQEGWVQKRVIIQDFCMSEEKAAPFLEEALQDPGTFPLWLCPIQGAKKEEIFSPHAVGDRIINIGIYGLPSHGAPIETITSMLEKKTMAMGGRKVLYARSYYTPEEFWQIYSKEAYEALRKKTHADGMWIGITDKVLAE